MDYPFNGPLKNGRMRDKNELYNKSQNGDVWD